MDETKEEIKNLQKTFWMSIGMIARNAPDGTDLTEMVKVIDEMFEDKIKKAKKE